MSCGRYNGTDPKRCSLKPCNGNDAVGASLRALINSIAWVIGMN